MTSEQPQRGDHVEQIQLSASLVGSQLQRQPVCEWSDSCQLFPDLLSE